MFKDISSVTSVKFNTNKNVKIKSMESLFENCESLSNFDITGFDTSEVKSLKKVFYNCYSLESLDSLEKISTKQITDMSYMFASTEIFIFSPENFDTSSVTNMSHMFEDCHSLNEINFPESLDTSNLKDISYNLINYCIINNIINNTKRLKLLSFFLIKFFH